MDDIVNVAAPATAMKRDAHSGSAHPNADLGDAGTEGLPPTSMVSVPDVILSARTVFGIDSDLQVPAFSLRTEHVPDIDPAYKFDHETTIAILAGFAYNRRVMIQAITAPANRVTSSRSRRA